MFAAIVLAATLDAATLAHPDIQACMQSVLKEGGYGHLPREGAAFLIEKDGAFECRMWSRRGGLYSQYWEGVIPEGTVAIIHSHPADRPDPSWNDTVVARRLRMPVFVVTPRRVTRTE